MHKMGIYKGEQLRKVSLTHLVQVFGKMGSVLYDFARGIDNRPVEAYRERKSVGCEQTFFGRLEYRIESCNSTLSYCYRAD